MSFLDYLPGLIVAGYLVMGVLLRAGGKLRAKRPAAPADRVPIPPPRGVTLAPVASGQVTGDAGRIRTWARVSTWAAVLVGLATTTTWLVVALDPSDFVVLGAILLGLVVFSLVLAAALGTESGARKFLGTMVTMVLAADFWFLLLSPLLYLLGLTRDISIHVTAVFESSSVRSVTDSTTVQGTYLLDGATHHADIWWTGWGWRPAEGETISAGVSPAWPHQIYADTVGAWFMVGMAVLVPVFVGLIYVGSARGIRRLRRRGHPTTTRP
ncbi:hypothetical protein [Amycolatopsis cihanbeyliensis]|uniref:Uncharacterized protein n=1 Tax=Amycolatopsis cihanbeyliensis TaxID=1128664 RepID=A0A542DJE7_AMYCI|nr:hypothetical protein [Amycolatopsis cihanbeyliensis]TQJ03218.1 hypothetical protein FB471_2970 [Amycolatopsis cihanbeyliensis]